MIKKRAKQTNFSNTSSSKKQWKETKGFQTGVSYTDYVYTIATCSLNFQRHPTTEHSPYLYIVSTYLLRDSDLTQRELFSHCGLSLGGEELVHKFRILRNNQMKMKFN
eukprot:TCONS_00024424-protein